MHNTTILITSLKAKFTFTQRTTLNTRSKNKQQMCAWNIWNRPAVSVLFSLKHTNDHKQHDRKTLGSIISNSNWHTFKNKWHSRKRIFSGVWWWKPDEMIQCLYDWHLFACCEVPWFAILILICSEPRMSYVPV